MRFLFQSRNDLVETPEISGVDTTNHSPFQCEQMTLDTLCQPSPFGR